MRVLVAGAHNLNGRIILEKLKEANHEAIALTNVPAHREDLMKHGASEVLVAHLVRGVDAIDEYMRQHPIDAFIFAAGASGKPPIELVDEKKMTEIDRDGAIEMANLCLKHHTKMFMLSSMGVENPMGEAIPDELRHYLLMKADADAYLKELGLRGENRLHYVIFRPGYMLDSEGTGKVTMKEYIELHPKSNTTREDVATVLVEALNVSDQLDGRVLYFTEGNTPIKDALAVHSTS